MASSDNQIKNSRWQMRATTSRQWPVRIFGKLILGLEKF
jgi:hypothetical protein